MNYKQLLKDTWEIAKNYKLVWLLGAIQLFSFNDLISTISSGYLAIACFLIILPIIFIFLTVYGQVGLIQVVNKAMSGEKTSLLDIWMTIKARLGQLIILYVIMSIFFIIPSFCLRLLVSFSQLPALIFLVMLFFSIFSFLVIPFALCGVIVGEFKAYKSINLGLLLSLRNFKRVLYVGFSFWFIQRFIVGIAGFFLMSGQGDVPLSILFSFNQQILVEIPEQHVLYILNYAASLLTNPLEWIMFTIMYIKFTAVEPPDGQELGEVIS